MKKHSVQNGCYPKQSVKGATLLEVLVSVFLLTFGILGLMAAQLRSVSAVAESEAQSIVAQAAENLAEAMQANPKLETNGTRSYANYINAATNLQEVSKPASCDDVASTTASKDACNLSGSGVTKAELIAAQLGEFEYILSQVPNVVQMRYAICLDNPSNIGAIAGITGPVNCNPTTNSSAPVIKVVWTTQKQDDENPNSVVVHNYALAIPN